MIPFEDLTYLFSCGVETRGIVRLDLDEAALLYKYVKKSTGDILEIGRKYGGSALLMASAIENGRMVHSVDLVNWPQIHENLKKADKETVERIDIIVGESIETSKNWEHNLGLLFIDGDHQFDAVMADVNAWSPFVIEGGYVALHDVRGTHLKLEPVIDYLKETDEWQEVDCVDTLVVMQKVGGEVCPK